MCSKERHAGMYIGPKEVPPPSPTALLEYEQVWLLSFAQRWLNSGRLWPNSVNLWAHGANFGPNVAEPGQTWYSKGRSVHSALKYPGEQQLPVFSSVERCAAMFRGCS